MKTKKIIWANFSVKDAGRTRQFYTRLGVKPNSPNNDPKLASFIFGENDFVIHFFEEGSQIDEYLPSVSKSSEIMFSIGAETEAEVNEWMEKVKAAGGTIIKEAGRDKDDYFVLVFADPDGHQFNILLMDKM